MAEVKAVQRVSLGVPGVSNVHAGWLYPPSHQLSLVHVIVSLQLKCWQCFPSGARSLPGVPMSTTVTPLGGVSYGLNAGPSTCEHTLYRRT